MFGYWLSLTTSTNCVPLSRCTFLPAEVMTDPSAPVEAAELKAIPFNRNTPWLFAVSWPASSRPEPSPRAAPLVLPAMLPAEPSGPLPVAFGSVVELAVPLGTDPAFEAGPAPPPIVPRPPARPGEEAALPAPLLGARS